MRTRGTLGKRTRQQETPFIKSSWCFIPGTVFLDISEVKWVSLHALRTSLVRRWNIQIHFPHAYFFPFSASLCCWYLLQSYVCDTIRLAFCSYWYCSLLLSIIVSTYTFLPIQVSSFPVLAIAVLRGVHRDINIAKIKACHLRQATCLYNLPCIRGVMLWIKALVQNATDFI